MLIKSGRNAGLLAAFLVLVASTSSGVAGAVEAGVAPDAAPETFVRVNQAGYPPAGAKTAFVLATTDLAGDPFRVETVGGAIVLTGTIGPNVDAWNARYDFVGKIDFSSLAASGTYVVTIEAPDVSSPAFQIAPAQELYAPLAVDARTFFQAQRDGEDVVAGELGREPAHLNDATATSYAQPTYDGFDLVGDLDPVGGPVDVDGGWSDAGDYVKFVQTTSYADALLLVAARDAPEVFGAGGPADLLDEVRHGTDWLLKMWDDESRTLHYQVGIGDGNGCGSICADHDIWRLPEVDDTFGGAAPKYRYIRERPAFRAAPAGAAVSPNLAGRLVASFGVCAQVFRSVDPTYADRCLRAGERVYALADASWRGKLLTVSPRGYYPETSWHDDLELGATELALAVVEAGRAGGAATPTRSAVDYLAEAAQEAKRYLKKEADDSLNLYDVGGLAHVELHRAIDALGGDDDLAISQAALRKDLRRQLDAGERQADRDPFGVAYPYGYDLTSHLFGLVATAVSYGELTGSDRYAVLAAQQLDAIYGANAWGTSFVVGAGERFPFCLQHQVANLNGSRDGSAPVLAGAVVNGPNEPSQFDDLGLPDGARACPVGGGDAFKVFTGNGGRYQDDVRAWVTVEPSIDFTATSALALARVAAGG